MYLTFQKTGSLTLANIGFVCLCIFFTSLTYAAGPPANKRATKKTPTNSEPPIAAMVGDEPVYAAEVDDIIAGTRQARASAGSAGDLRGPALDQAINRRLAAQYLAKNGYAVDDAETDDLVKELKRKLENQQLTFDEFLERHSFNDLMVRRRLQWDAMWAEFLTNEASDEALEKFFEKHRRDYDGTELRISHILWPVKPDGDPTKVSAAVKEADEVRSRIVAGKLKFAAAAEKYSAGPSRRRGGDLGFIPAHDVMSEAFTRAAFELSKGDVSKPVVDQFGVHLITCTDIKPGERTWRDARRELFDAFAREKFLELAETQRKQIDVKIMDGVQ